MSSILTSPPPSLISSSFPTHFSLFISTISPLITPHPSLHSPHPPFILPLTHSKLPPSPLLPQGLLGPSSATNTHMRAFPPNMISTAVRFPSLRETVLGVRSPEGSARNSLKIKSPRSFSHTDTGTGLGSGTGTGTGVPSSTRYF